ncbi:MAG TPA: hypothetical protein VKG79_04795 [Bryobacteraceae bacterium]|nr:hypothetical protein [Bryobacteraceae bacterium]
MASKLTRRQLAVVVAAPLVLAQTPAPPIPQNADDELKAIRDQNRQISDLLAKFPMLITIEPCTHFRA